MPTSARSTADDTLAAKSGPAAIPLASYEAYRQTPPESPGYRVGPPYPPQTDRAAEEAEPDDPAAPPNLDLALGTLFPLSLGPQITVELPGRLLLQADLGWMPPAYGSLINRLVGGFGGYNGAYEALIDGALDDGLVLRATGGWRPFPAAGFELFGGYTLIDLNGSASPEDVAAVVGGDFAAAVAAGSFGDRIELDSTLHSFHVGLGWRWVVVDHLVIRVNLAYMQAVASSSSVTTPGARELGELATPTVDEELGDIYDQYVKLPVLGLSGGYRF